MNKIKIFCENRKSYFGRFKKQILSREFNRFSSVTLKSINIVATPSIMPVFWKFEKKTLPKQQLIVMKMPYNFLIVSMNELQLFINR